MRGLVAARGLRRVVIMSVIVLGRNVAGQGDIARVLIAQGGDRSQGQAAIIECTITVGVGVTVEFVNAVDQTDHRTPTR